MMNIYSSAHKKDHTLGKTKSYFAGEAENGQQVIDHLEKEPVDLLLLDIKCRR